MDRSLKQAKNDLVADIQRLEHEQRGRDARLSVRNNPTEQPALYTVIPIHKMILCARSPVFLAMMVGEMEEAVKCEVVIEDCSLTAVKSMVSFMYTGTLSFGCVSHCVNVYTAADKYKIKGLMDLCNAYLLQKIRSFKSTMEKDEFSTIWNAAEENNLLDVEEACLWFLVKNGKQLKQSWSYPSFLTLEKALKVLQYGIENARVKVAPLKQERRGYGSDDSLPDLVSEFDSDYSHHK